MLCSVGEPLPGDAGPSWLPDEVEIGLMVLVGLVAAGLLLRRRPEPARRGVASAEPRRVCRASGGSYKAR